MWSWNRLCLGDEVSTHWSFGVVGLEVKGGEAFVSMLFGLFAACILPVYCVDFCSLQLLI